MLKLVHKPGKSMSKIWAIVKMIEVGLSLHISEFLLTGVAANPATFTKPRSQTATQQSKALPMAIAQNTPRAVFFEFI